MQSDLRATLTPGNWTPATAITAPQRQRLDADLDQLLEDLSTIPDLLGAEDERMSGVARRSSLRGAAVGAASAAAVGGAAGVAAAAVAGARRAWAVGRRIAFEGPHQAGILLRSRMLRRSWSFDAIAARSGRPRRVVPHADRSCPVPDRRAACQRPRMSASAADRQRDARAGVPSDGLTVTVGVGASLFDDRFGLAARKPAQLTAMPVFPDDHVDGSTELHGDVMLQICADSRDTVMHALRDIAKHTRGGHAAGLEGRRLPCGARGRRRAAQPARLQGRDREPGRRRRLR